MNGEYCFFNDTATTEIYTLSLHDALPIFAPEADLEDGLLDVVVSGAASKPRYLLTLPRVFKGTHVDERSEEHTSELQSRQYPVCRLLLAKKTSCDGYTASECRTLFFSYDL